MRTRSARGITVAGRMSVCLVLVLVTAMVLTIGGLCTASAKAPGPAVGDNMFVPPAAASYLSSFLQDATYLRFMSGSTSDLALAQANMNNAQDLLHWVAGLQALATPDATDGAATLAFKNTLGTDLAEVMDACNQLALARGGVVEGFGGGRDSSLTASLIPGAGMHLNSIEDGAAASLSNFKKSWKAVVVRLQFSGLFFPNQMFPALAVPAALTQ
jgi:hypothetical protein